MRVFVCVRVCMQENELIKRSCKVRTEMIHGEAARNLFSDHHKKYFLEKLQMTEYFFCLRFTLMKCIVGIRYS